MGRAVRNVRSEVPRKRVLKVAAAPVVKPELGVRQEAVALALLVVGVFIAVSLWSHLSGVSGQVGEQGERVLVSHPNTMGRLGALTGEIFFGLLGWCSFIVVVWCLLLSRAVWMSARPAEKTSIFSVIMTLLASGVMAISSATMASVIFGFQGGGAIGSRVAFRLVPYVNEAGTLLLSAAVFLLALNISTGLGTARLLYLARRSPRYTWMLARDSWQVMQKTYAALRWSNSILGRILFFLVSRTIRFVMSIVSLLTAGLGFFISPFMRRRKKRLQELEDARRPFVMGKSTVDEPAEESYELFSEEEDNESSDETVHIARTENSKVRSSRLKKGLWSRKRTSKVASSETKEKDFQLPPLELLAARDEHSRQAPRDDELLRNARRLEETLQHFRIGGKVVEVHPGPVVTLYQVVPAAGIKVQRIVNLADDLALSLKVASVRVYAPVPGKGTVGIEVPNADREIVRLREILEHPEFSSLDTPLTLAIGKDTYGEPFVADLAKMPHLLIAGATGTGKSVCINSLLLSLLYRNTPRDLRLIMIDPKMLELSIYEDIPHLRAPVVTDAKRARAVLWWAVEEMDRRYRLMMELGVRNLASYNRSVSGADDEEKKGAASDEEEGDIIELTGSDVVATPHDLGIERGAGEMQLALPVGTAAEQNEVLPRIVIVVDELADLMLTVGREIEELLTRLAQKARAAGIHLILATQRPSVNVITGLIKANFPARISFKVASKIDARTVLDVSGAEKLLGQGDMLFSSPSSGRVKRLHSPFVSDKEVNDVVRWLREQGGPDYDEAIEAMLARLEEAEKSSHTGIGGEEETDPLYDQAVQLVVEKGQASTSMIQRVFRIGYNRAARILETMENEGVVGPQDGAKARAVLRLHRDGPI